MSAYQFSVTGTNFVDIKVGGWFVESFFFFFLKLKKKTRLAQEERN